MIRYILYAIIAFLMVVLFFLYLPKQAVSAPRFHTGEIGLPAEHGFSRIGGPNVV